MKKTYLHYIYYKLKAAVRDEESRGIFLVGFWLFCLFAGLVLMCINSFFEFKLGLVWLVPAAVFCIIGFAPFVFVWIVQWRQYLHWTLLLIILPYTLGKWIYKQLMESHRNYKIWKGWEDPEVLCFTCVDKDTCSMRDSIYAKITGCSVYKKELEMEASDRKC